MGSPLFQSTGKLVVFLNKDTVILSGKAVDLLVPHSTFIML